MGETLFFGHGLGGRINFSLSLFSPHYFFLSMFRFLSSRESNPSSEDDHCCIVCFDDENQLTFTTEKCNHHVCQDCMVQYLRTYLDKGSSIMRDYETIPCPQLKCNQEFQAATIIDLVMPSHEQAATWWQKLIEKTTIDNLVYITHHHQPNDAHTYQQIF